MNNAAANNMPPLGGMGAFGGANTGIPSMLQAAKNAPISPVKAVEPVPAVNADAAGATAALNQVTRQQGVSPGPGPGPGMGQQQPPPPQSPQGGPGMQLLSQLPGGWASGAPGSYRDPELLRFFRERLNPRKEIATDLLAAGVPFGEKTASAAALLRGIAYLGRGLRGLGSGIRGIGSGIRGIGGGIRGLGRIAVSPFSKARNLGSKFKFLGRSKPSVPSSKSLRVIGKTFPSHALREADPWDTTAVRNLVRPPKPRTMKAFYPQLMTTMDYIPPKQLKNFNLNAYLHSRPENLHLLRGTQPSRLAKLWSDWKPFAKEMFLNTAPALISIPAAGGYLAYDKLFGRRPKANPSAPPGAGNPVPVLPPRPNYGGNDVLNKDMQQMIDAIERLHGPTGKANPSAAPGAGNPVPVLPPRPNYGGNDVLNKDMQQMMDAIDRLKGPTGNQMLRKSGSDGSVDIEGITPFARGLLQGLAKKGNLNRLPGLLPVIEKMGGDEAVNEVKAAMEKCGGFLDKGLRFLNWLRRGGKAVDTATDVGKAVDVATDAGKWYGSIRNVPDIDTIVPYTFKDVGAESSKLLNQSAIRAGQTVFKGPGRLRPAWEAFKSNIKSPGILNRGFSAASGAVLGPVNARSYAGDDYNIRKEGLRSLLNHPLSMIAGALIGGVGGFRYGVMPMLHGYMGGTTGDIAGSYMGGETGRVWGRRLGTVLGNLMGFHGLFRGPVKGKVPWLGDEGILSHGLQNLERGMFYPLAAPLSRVPGFKWLAGTSVPEAMKAGWGAAATRYLPYAAGAAITTPGLWWPVGKGLTDVAMGYGQSAAENMKNRAKSFIRESVTEGAPEAADAALKELKKDPKFRAALQLAETLKDPKKSAKFIRDKVDKVIATVFKNPELRKLFEGLKSEDLNDALKLVASIQRGDTEKINKAVSEAVKKNPDLMASVGNAVVAQSGFANIPDKLLGLILPSDILGKMDMWQKILLLGGLVTTVAGLITGSKGATGVGAMSMIGSAVPFLMTLAEEHGLGGTGGKKKPVEGGNNQPPPDANAAANAAARAEASRATVI